MKSDQPRAADGTAQKKKITAVFLRKASVASRSADPVNIYINGQYQASLVGDVFTEVALCPGTHQFQAAFTDYVNRYRHKQTGAPVVLSDAPMQYFLIDESTQGKAELMPIDAQRAAATMPSVTRLQTHSISRVVNDGCALGKV